MNHICRISKSGSENRPLIPLNKIIFRLIILFLLVIVFLSEIQCIGCSWTIPKGDCPVTEETYQKDKTQIQDFMYSNLEYYRLNHDSCSPDYYRGFFVFKYYTERLYEKQGVYKASPIKSHEEYNIVVDTIVYSKDCLKCIAFIVFQYKHVELKGWERKREQGRECDGWAWVGIRNNIEEPFDLYRSETFGVAEYPNVKSAASIIEELYYTKLKDANCMTAPFNNLLFTHNVGEPDFFEDAPYFQPFHRDNYRGRFHFEDSAVICQICYGTGDFYKYNFPCSIHGQ